MVKKPCALALALILLASAAALAEAVDFSQLEGVTRYDEAIQVTFAKTMSPTVTLDESDPEKKSYTENRWITTFKDALNIDVSYKWIASDSDSNNAKWGAAIASGDLPDAAVVTNVVYKQLLEAGLIADMTDLYATELSDQFKSLLNDDLVGSMTYGGRLYGLPLSANMYISNALMFVRGDWLAQLGLAVPTTVDEAIAVARAFQEAKLGGEDTIGMMFADGAGVHDGLLKGFMNSCGAYRDIWVDVDGQLVWSNLLPEMREALIMLQSLYQEGLINEDFVVTNGTLAQEYVASGKCGIFYSTDYATTMSMQSLMDLDPDAEIICVGMPGLAADQAAKLQTGPIVATKLFVNSESAHPEAVVRMLNLNAALCLHDSAEVRYAYETSADGFTWYMFLPWHNPRSIINDITIANDVRVWQETGVEQYTLPTTYDVLKACQDETSPWWYRATFGQGGSYTYDYDVYMEGRMLPNAYTDLPTATMEMLGDIVNDALNTAMLEVIMGADIATYDQAVTAWITNGGQAITDEVNAWYATK